MANSKIINPKVRWVGEVTLDLIQKGFYGTMEVCFEKGTPTRIIKKESIKPPKRYTNENGQK